MLDLEWKESARTDLLELVDYIARDNPIAALKLLDELEAKAERLRERPKLYRPGRVDGTREMVVRPNYIVVYTIRAETVVILRVLHAARRWPHA